MAGNLWGDEAAAVAHEIGARLAVPMHFELFVFNTEPPDAFVEACERLGQPYRVLRAGERLSVTPLEGAQRERHADLGAAVGRHDDREGVREAGDQRQPEPGARAVCPRLHAAAMITHDDVQQVVLPLDRDGELAGLRRSR